MFALRNFKTTLAVFLVIILSGFIGACKTVDIASGSPKLMYLNGDYIGISGFWETKWTEISVHSGNQVLGEYVTRNPDSGLTGYGSISGSVNSNKFKFVLVTQGGRTTEYSGTITQTKDAVILEGVTDSGYGFRVSKKKTTKLSKKL